MELTKNGPKTYTKNPKHECMNWPSSDERTKMGEIAEYIWQTQLFLAIIAEF